MNHGERLMEAVFSRIERIRIAAAYVRGYLEPYATKEEGLSAAEVAVLHAKLVVAFEEERIPGVSEGVAAEYIARTKQTEEAQ